MIPKDESVLRLYVRDKKTARPDDEYFNAEYSRYQKCKKQNVKYKVKKGCVPYIRAFDKIRLIGTQMSIWQAYLLDCSKYMFGMRNEANYNKEYIITSAQDIDSLISYIYFIWDLDLFGNQVDTAKFDKHGTMHFNDAKVVIDSLNDLKSRNLEPFFKYHKNSVTIDHYTFREFYGLAQKRTTIKLSRNHRHIRAFEKPIYENIAEYRRCVYY